MSKILPSLLGIKDLNELKYFLNEIKDTNIDELHFDIMDGVFVENKCDNLDDIPLVKENNHIANVHLMVENPEEYIEKAVKLGADSITIHYEIKSFEDMLSLLHKYKKETDFKIGVSICPQTDISALKSIIDQIDIVLVMSVNPGKGGQPFMEDSYNRINEIRKLSSNIRIIVDGGINDTNISEVLNSGADSVVVGSYITKDITIVKNKINNLNSLI